MPLAQVGNGGFRWLLEGQRLRPSAIETLPITRSQPLVPKFFFQGFGGGGPGPPKKNQKRGPGPRFRDAVRCMLAVAVLTNHHIHRWSENPL